MEMGSNLKSIVYMTVNTVNNKIYVGVHITEKPYEFDGYYGNGVTGTGSYHFKHPKAPFHFACKKYGLKAFKRYTLFVFDNYEDALRMEAIIVDDEFVKRADTYNVAHGGGAGLVPTTEIEIHQYDLEGNYVRSYRSKADAGRKNNVSPMTLQNAIIYKTESCGSYWSETKVARLNLDDAKEKQAKKLYYYNSDGSFAGECDSISKYAKKFEVCLASVQRAIEFGTKCAGHYLSLEKLDKFVPPKRKRTRNKTIYQYDDKGNFLNEFTNCQDIKPIVGKQYNQVWHAIAGKYKIANYYWSFEKMDKFPLPETKKVYIEQYDLNGNLVKVWNSYRECYKEFSMLRHVLNGTRKQTKGFTFKAVKQVKDIV